VLRQFLLDDRMCGPERIRHTQPQQTHGP
jgi:hypothetical protein